MNSRILELAQSCGLEDMARYEPHANALVAFYRAAYNDGIEAAAGEVRKWHKVVCDSAAPEGSAAG